MSSYDDAHGYGEWRALKDYDEARGAEERAVDESIRLAEKLDAMTAERDRYRLAWMSASARAFANHTQLQVFRRLVNDYRTRLLTADRALRVSARQHRRTW